MAAAKTEALPVHLSVHHPHVHAPPPLPPGTPDAAASELQVRLGRVMRALKEQWKLAAVLVPLLCLPQAALLGDELPSHTPRESAGAGATGADAVRALLAAAAGFGLDGCWSWKPLFNGKQVRGFLGILLMKACGCPM